MSYEEFNFEGFTYIKIINKNLEEFMEKLDFSVFIPLKQIIKIDLVTISDKFKVIYCLVSPHPNFTPFL